MLNPMIPSWQASWKLIGLSFFCLTVCLATVTTRRRFASMRAAFARCDLRICFLSCGTVMVSCSDHSPNVGGL
jgi:hypothetical protein